MKSFLLWVGKIIFYVACILITLYRFSPDHWFVIAETVLLVPFFWFGDFISELWAYGHTTTGAVIFGVIYLGWKIEGLKK